MDGKEDEEVLFSQGKDDRPLVECEAESDRCACEPLAQDTHPRLNGFWRVFEDRGLSCRGAGRLEANIMCGIGPVEADEGRKCFGGFWLHVCSPSV